MALGGRFYTYLSREREGCRCKVILLQAVLLKSTDENGYSLWRLRAKAAAVFQDIRSYGCLLALSCCTGLLLSACASNSSLQAEISAWEKKIDELRTQFAPDTRRALWRIRLEQDEEGLYIRGEVEEIAALEALKKLGLRDSLELWPDTSSLRNKLRGVVHNSVANLRAEASHSSELVSQALLGTPLRLLTLERNWCLVQTPDEYIAWIDTTEMSSMTEQTFRAWLREKKLFYIYPEGYTYSSPREEVIVSDIVIGAIVSRTGRKQLEHEEIRYPDGRKGWLRSQECTELETFHNSLSSNGTQKLYRKEYILTAAPKTLGIPYLWGGTSIKGMDCSGFTKMLFFIAGWIIPRDASQQAEEGDTIDTSSGWENLQPCDMLFFGRREEKRDKITHVGLWLGNGHFIHASGRVRLSSVHPTDEVYDSANVQRFLYAKPLWYFF